jgi:hypothetical protein
MDWMTKTEKENPSLFGPIGKSKGARNDLKPVYTGNTSSSLRSKNTRVNNESESDDDYDDNGSYDNRSTKRYDDDDNDGSNRRKKKSSVRRAVNRSMRFLKGMNDDEKLVFGVVSAAVVIGIVLFVLRVRSVRAKNAMNKELEQKQQSLAVGIAGESASSSGAQPLSAGGDDVDVVRAIKLATADCRFLHEKFALAKQGIMVEGADMLTDGEHGRMESHLTALRSIASQHSSEAIFAATGTNIGDLIKTVEVLVAMPVAASSGIEGSWRAPGASPGLTVPTAGVGIGGNTEARRIPRRNPFARPLSD